MRLGLIAQRVLVPLYASYRPSVVAKYGLLWSGMFVDVMTTEETRARVGG